MTVNDNLAVVHSFLTSLWHAGVNQICLSPGSRSTPLAALVSRDDRFRVWSILDERSAAFFAVGLARAAQRPVVLICTSGTAAGNYLPAVMEARFSAVPLILITADRPPELRDIGSNQTVFQAELYGSHVKWFYEMPVPELSNLETLHKHALYIGARAVSEATAAPKGPVHINYPFREPLMPPMAQDIDPMYVAPHMFEANLTPSAAGVYAARKLLSEARRPVVVCGPQDDVAAAEAIAHFCSEHRIPILADPLSQLRGQVGYLSGVVIDTYDLALRSPDFQQRMCPDLIIRMGRTLSSKVMLQSLEQWRDTPQVVVFAEETMADPTLSASIFIQSDTRLFLDALRAQSCAFDSTWLSSWQKANRLIRDRLSVLSRLDDEFSAEGRVFQELADLMPSKGALFVGNSMPIRYADLYWPTSAQVIQAYGNRGASGIDGIVSSAFGVAASNIGPTTLVIGDISFYHDLPGLLAAVRLGLSLQVILMNNDGGGIFKHLNQAKYPDVIEAFTTPHGMEYEQVVRMFQGTWTRPVNWMDFAKAMREGSDTCGLSVVELRFDKDASVDKHREIVQTVLEDLEEWLRDREHQHGTCIER